jgi:serine/threonine protein kinase
VLDSADEVEIDLAAGPPETVGRFRVGPEVARGGMASVHLASPIDEPSRVLAIKLVHPQLADDGDFVEMFLDEARISSRIVHPRVCRVYEYGEADDTLYLTMELLRGVSLTKLVRALKRKPALLVDPRWPKLVARVLADVCAGLHAAHELKDEQGAPMHVVHRDVSPQNIFVCWDGTSRILDFGIAAADHRLHKTAAGTVKGKFSYIAPEQIQSSSVDRRADVWAIGVVLWELLAGRALFKGAHDAATITAVLAAKVPSIEGTPRELEAIIENVIRPDRDKRPATAAELQRALEDWLGDFGSEDVAKVLEELLPGERENEALRIAEQARGVKPNTSDPPEQQSASHPALSHVRPKTPLPPAPTRWPFYLAIGLITALVAYTLWTIGQHLR